MVYARLAFSGAMQRIGPLLLTLVVVVAVVAVGRSAWAHAVGLSKGEYAVEGASVRAELVFARGELAAAVPALDPDEDGFVSQDDVVGARAAIERLMQGGVLVRGDGRTCPGVLQDARATEEDGVEVRASYACPGPPSRLELQLKVLDELPQAHRHVAHVVAGVITVDEVTRRGHDTVEVSVQPMPDDAPKAPLGALGFVQMGIEHILAGYDHIVFLLGLVLVGGRLRSLVAVVTAFTVGHSVTLASAVLGTWAAPARVVEPLIALSVAYVGIENFFVKSVENRWRITFPFGLVHGLGFAAALREVAVPRGEVAPALLGFNVGVELGQLALLAMALPVVAYLRKRPWFSARGIGALSGAVALAGGFWFVERVLRGG